MVGVRRAGGDIGAACRSGDDIGGVGVLVGDKAVAVFSVLPFSVLGALLCFAGAQLAMMILDVKERADLFVVGTMLAVSLVSNLGIGFGVGIVAAYLFRYTKMKV